MTHRLFDTTTTDEKMRQKLHHDDTHEWKLAQNCDKLDLMIRRARDNLQKRELQKEAEKRWFQENPKRDMVKHLLNSSLFEGGVFVLIFGNFLMTIYETDLGSTDKPPWLSICASSCVAFYVIELSFRFFVYGPRFLNNTSNIVDLLIVLVDVVCTVVDFLASTDSLGPTFFRIFRALRLVRALRIIKHFHELYLMLYGLISTLKAIFWAVVLIFMVVTCCSIIAVNFVHPVNLEVVADGVYEGTCTRCPHAFRSVGEANITFIQQILAGDNWGQVTLPIIDKAPWTLYFFVLVLLIVNLGLMNLVLTVIVDQASQAAHENVEESLVEKMHEFRNDRERLMQVCASMDTDLSGKLDLSEFMRGYDSNSQFSQYLNLMDVKRDDLETMFRILDRDGSGDLTYSEFVEELHKAKTQDPHTLLVFMRYHMQQVMDELGNIANRLESTGSQECLPNLYLPVPVELCEKSQSGKERTDDNNQSVETAVKFEGGGEDDDAIDFHAEQRAEVPFSNEHLPKQSSSRESGGAYAEKGVFPPADVNRPLRPRSTTLASNFPQPSALRQPAARSFTQPTARSFTQPELKDVQDSIAKAIEVIVRDSLALSGERMRELTKHPDFLDLLHGLDTSPWTGDMFGERFLPVQPMEHKGVSNFSAFHQSVSLAGNDPGHILGPSGSRNSVSL